MTLEGFLAQIVAGGAVLGVIVFWLMERVKGPDIPDTQAWFLGMSVAQVKRYLSIILAVVVVWGAFAITVALGYNPCPGTAKEWLEVLFPLGATAVAMIVSQAVHGATRMGVKAS